MEHQYGSGSKPPAHSNSNTHAEIGPLASNSWGHTYLIWCQNMRSHWIAYASWASEPAQPVRCTSSHVAPAEGITMSVESSATGDWWMTCPPRKLTPLSPSTIPKKYDLYTNFTIYMATAWTQHAHLIQNFCASHSSSQLRMAKNSVNNGINPGTREKLSPQGH